MSAAEKARANAIPLEVKKDGLQQRQNGDWVLRLVVQAADMDPRLTNAAMGTRFQAALVEVGEDEQPIERAKKERIEWREMQPAAQCAIRCGEPRFRDYLAVEHGITTDDAETAATALRLLFNIKSRTEFSTNHRARMLWNQMDSGYREWAHL
jgi:hypothetical protein